MVLFIDTMLFFYPFSVNPSFLGDRVKKITTRSNFCIVSNKTMQAFDIVSKKYNVLMSIDSMGLFYGTVLTIRTKMEMTQQNNYRVINRVNYRADAKRFTHRRCKKLTISQNDIQMASRFE